MTGYQIRRGWRWGREVMGLKNGNNNNNNQVKCGQEIGGDAGKEIAIGMRG